MKTAMTNITVSSMIALPLLLVGWLIYPYVYDVEDEITTVTQTAYISELEAVQEYQNTCNSLDYSCNEELIQNVQENASKRSWDAQASSISIFEIVEEWLN